MSNRDVVLRALLDSSEPLGLVDLMRRTHLNEYELFDTLYLLVEEGCVAEMPRPLGPNRPPLRFFAIPGRSSGAPRAPTSTE